jgi:hypothetical protein
MTIIGKILTFLIFVFSLLFLGFAIIINQVNKDPRTRESWYSVALRLQKERQSYLDDIKAMDEERVSLRSQVVAHLAELKALNDRMDKLKAETAQSVSVAENAKDTAVRNFQQQQVIINTIQNDIAKKTEEVVALSERLKAKDQQISEMGKIVTDEKNKRITAEIERGTLRERLQVSERTNMDLVRQIEEEREKQTRAVSPGELVKPQPPPSDVQGTVTNVTEDGYIGVNKGSDHGLAKGQTLEVYRMAPKGEYVGLMRLLEVNNHESVGIIVQPQNRKVTVKKGDLVGSTILPAGRSR